MTQNLLNRWNAQTSKAESTEPKSVPTVASLRNRAQEIQKQVVRRNAAGKINAAAADLLSSF